MNFLKVVITSRESNGNQYTVAPDPWILFILQPKCALHKKLQPMGSNAQPGALGSHSPKGLVAPPGWGVQRV